MSEFFNFNPQNTFNTEDPIIFTNGVFDLLHIGHIKFLQACKALGGHVVVGINSDSSVKRLKGEYRPINNEFERKHTLLALDCVDEVLVFVEDNPLEIIKMMQPEIYAKSDEYMNVDLPEFRAVQEYGGKIAIVTPDEQLRKSKTSNKIDLIFERELKRRLNINVNSGGHNN